MRRICVTHGYQLIGPTVRDGAIIYYVITSVDDLPIGYIDEQREGYYPYGRIRE